MCQENAIKILSFSFEINKKMKINSSRLHKRQNNCSRPLLPIGDECRSLLRQKKTGKDIALTAISMDSTIVDSTRGQCIVFYFTGIIDISLGISG